MAMPFLQFSVHYPYAIDFISLKGQLLFQKYDYSLQIMAFWIQISKVIPENSQLNLAIYQEPVVRISGASAWPHQGTRDTAII